MYSLKFRNPHQAFPVLIGLLRQEGYKRDSRNGPVTMLPGPLTVTYERPQERVVFWPERDANPFFHAIEALWMLAGRNDLAPLTRYVKQMAAYSDDGVTLNAAYGHRWRREFGFDQLDTIVHELIKDPDCRRQVLQIWSPKDLGKNGKDLACNTQAYFTIAQDGRLDMTVTNRSNDLVWGMLGANCVHFSLLLEYMAVRIGVGVGRYHHFTNNLHAYDATINDLWPLGCAVEPHHNDPYELMLTTSYPLNSYDVRNLQAEANMFFSEPGAIGIKSKWMRRVIMPIEAVHRVYRELKGQGRDRYIHAIAECEEIIAPDWRRACEEWLYRRLELFDTRRESQAHKIREIGGDDV